MKRTIGGPFIAEKSKQNACGRQFPRRKDHSHDANRLICVPENKVFHKLRGEAAEGCVERRKTLLYVHKHRDSRQDIQQA